MAKIFYTNYIEEQMKNIENAENLWELKNEQNLGYIYHGSVIIEDFNDWINNGMNETN